MMPTMMISISAGELDFLAAHRVEYAEQEKSDGDSKVNKVCHWDVLCLFECLEEKVEVALIR